MAILFGVLVCTNPIIFGFTDYVLSDLLLVLLTLIALTLCSQTREASLAHLLVISSVVGLACLTRTAALPLVFAGMLYALVSRGWRGAIVFVGGVGCLLAPWIFWVWLHAAPPVDSLFGYYTGYDPTGTQFSGLAQLLSSHMTVIAGNTRYLLHSFEMLYLTPLLPGLAIVLALLTLTGMVASIQRDEIFTWSFFLSSLALLLVWPFHPGRYLAPLIPILLLFLFRGCAQARSWLASVLPEGWNVAAFRERHGARCW